jgi:CheY-like chemotaxis protein
MSEPTAPDASPPIRVLVADDHTVVREGIRHVLEREPGFVVVAEAANGAEAIAAAMAERPDGCRSPPACATTSPRRACSS